MTYCFDRLVLFRVAVSGEGLVCEERGETIILQKSLSLFDFLPITFLEVSLRHQLVSQSLIDCYLRGSVRLLTDLNTLALRCNPFSDLLLSILFIREGVS